MIVSDLNHIENQLMMTPYLKKAIEFLRLRGIHDLPDGKIEIDGQKVFAIVERYETKVSGSPKFEYHKKYIDVQFITSGREIICWTPVENIMITEAYDPKKDVAFGSLEAGNWTSLSLQAGQLAVFFPEDGHASRLAIGKASAVMKIVAKVAL